MFLEPVQFVIAGQIGIGDDQPHHRDRQKPAFMQDRIGDGKDGQHADEQQRHLHVFGHPAPAKGLHDHPAGSDPHDHRKDDPDGEMPQRGGGRQVAVDHGYQTHRQHRRQRADGVVDDGFPLQDLRRARPQLGGAQQGRDDRGAGHDHDAAKHDRAFPAEPRAIDERQGRGQPAQRRTDIDQPSHRWPRIGKLLEAQRQPALEQDHRHRQRDHRRDQVADITRRHEDARHRPEDQPRAQHQHDGRQAESPGQPLRGNAGHTDDCERLDRVQPACCLCRHAVPVLSRRAMRSVVGAKTMAGASRFRARPTFLAGFSGQC